MSLQAGFVIDLGDVQSPADLVRKIDELHEAAGRPPASRISADIRHIISEATARQIIFQNVGSGQRDEIVAFAAALGGVPHAWGTAYDRAFPADAGDPPPPVPRRPAKLKWTVVGLAAGVVASLVAALAIPNAMGVGATGIVVTPSASESPAALPDAAGPASPRPEAHPAGPEPWHMTMVTGDDKNPDMVAIDVAFDGKRVAAAGPVAGSSTNPCCRRSTWIIAHPQGDDKAYPDQACTSHSAGTAFECTGMEIGEPDDPPGLWYSLVVVVLDAGEAPKFARANANGGFPLGTLPGTVRSVSNTIWVQRR